MTLETYLLSFTLSGHAENTFIVLLTFCEIRKIILLRKLIKLKGTYENMLADLFSGRTNELSHRSDKSLMHISIVASFIK